ncbi:MAG: PadR family transcriptional regulator [Francisellaceae bacterium]
MARQNNSQFAVLIMLAKRELSGYGIKAVFDKVAPFYWSEANAQIYPILKQLQEKALVTSKIDETSGKRQSRIYSITQAGREYLHDWLTQPVITGKERNELLLKISGAHELDKKELINHLDRYHIQLLEKQQTLKIIIEHVKTDHADRADQPYLQMVYDYSQRVLEAQLQWCQTYLNQLNDD